MIRATLTIGGILCVAIVFSEALGVALLWWQGQLDSETLGRLRDTIVQPTEKETSETAAAAARLPSNDEVIRERALRILDLQRRESELDQLKRLVDETGSDVLANLDRLEKQKGEFEDRLKTQTDLLTSEATEQSRAILSALPPEEAVRNLMQLPLEENVVLMKGLPEKSIARILQEFANNLEQTTQERGLEIFEAIAHGDPTNQMIRDTQQQLAAEPSGSPN